uniref:Uncharacterized protein AlNc14C15G1698 n=1 Tax=Albugo laibachii Nc14 TaxID=890382 RepID=F0W405_9STRA|nr:hypothetical protein TcasGA2_TC004282 [Albugo laibachii Nc14]|eukprot:CCA15801.1 hypothetical protein TcasGA2_TC004282 [Albugo laibachii Nc14]
MHTHFIVSRHDLATGNLFPTLGTEVVSLYVMHTRIQRPYPSEKIVKKPEMAQFRMTVDVGSERTNRETSMANAKSRSRTVQCPWIKDFCCFRFFQRLLAVCIGQELPGTILICHGFWYIYDCLLFYDVSYLNSYMGLLIWACESGRSVYRRDASPDTFLLYLPIRVRTAVMFGVICKFQRLSNDQICLSQVMFARTIPLRGRIKRKALFRMHVLVVGGAGGGTGQGARYARRLHRKDSAESSVFDSVLGVGAAMNLQALEHNHYPKRSPNLSPATYFGARYPAQRLPDYEYPGKDIQNPGFLHLGRQIEGVPDSQQRMFAPQPYDGKEIYHGIGSGFLEWGKDFVRQISFSERACGFSWPKDINVDVLGQHLAGTAQKYYRRQVECWWSENQTLEHAMQRLLQNFSTKITPAQSMKLFTVPKAVDRSWKYHFLYLTADRIVMVTQHVRNVETLNDNQNYQLSRFSKGVINQEELDDMSESRKRDHDIFDQKKNALKGSNRKQNLPSRWTRERYFTRSRCNAKTDTVEDKNIRDVVNAVCDLDPKNYGEATMSQGKHKWMTAVSEELKALGENGWVLKTKTDANGDVERYKARLVTCGNEQLSGVDYTLTFAAVMDLSTVKVILVLSRRWNVPARHGDVPNAIVNAENEPHYDVYMKVPKGMKIDEMDLKRCRANDLIKLELLLKLCKAGFTQCTTNICLYFKKDKDELTILGVYVDGLLATGISRDAVDKFFKVISALEIKELGVVNKFLGPRMSLDEEVGYVLNQEVSIDLLQREYGLEKANGVRAPIVEEFNDCNSQEPEYLPVTAANGNASVKDFQSLGDSTNAQAYYGRLEDGEAICKFQR